MKMIIQNARLQVLASLDLRLLTHVGFLRQNGRILSEAFLYMERSKNQEKKIHQYDVIIGSLQRLALKR